MNSLSALVPGSIWRNNRRGHSCEIVTYGRSRGGRLTIVYQPDGAATTQAVSPGYFLAHWTLDIDRTR